MKNERFIARHMMYERMAPLEPTSEPAMISIGLFSEKPMPAAAQPEYEFSHFAGAQAGAIGDRERGLVLQVPSGRQQSADFVGTDYHGQGAWNSYRSHLGHALRVAERHFKEELQSGDRGIERNRGDAVIDQMELIAP